MAEFTRHFFFPFFFCFLLFLQITTTTWGLSMVELYSVRVFHERVYGTITANSEAIYNKSRDDVHYNEISEILLTGPNEPLIFDVPTGRYVSIKSDLWNKGFIYQADTHFGTGLVKVDAEGETDLKYDTLIVQYLGETSNPTEFAYVIIKEAVVATITVIMTNGGSEYPYVCGEISAMDSKLGNFTYKVDLFRKAKDDRIRIIQGGSIELSRFAVGVSLNSSLLVLAYLTEYDLSQDKQIAFGNAEFPANATGTFSKSISGNNGREIQVNVTWNPITTSSSIDKVINPSTYVSKSALLEW